MSARMSVNQAKARLLELGHRPRGPKAMIQREPSVSVPRLATPRFGLPDWTRPSSSFASG